MLRMSCGAGEASPQLGGSSDPAERGFGRLLQRLANLVGVVVAMPNRMVLEEELAGERGIGVERDRSGAIQLLIAESPDGGRSCGAIAPQQVERRLLGDRVVLLGVLRVDRVDVVPAHAL